MSVYVFVYGTKGGVGKTTVANELAFELESRNLAVGYQNLDNQGGSVHKSTVLDGHEDFVIVDTPGYLVPKEVKKWAEMADIILFPVRASTLEAPAFLDDWNRMVETQHTHAKCAAVLNGYNPRTNAAKAFEKYLKQLQIPVWGKFPQAQAFVNAPSMQTSVSEIGRFSKAARAVAQLADRVIKESE